MYILITKSLSLKIGFPILFDQLISMSLNASSSVDKNVFGNEEMVSDQISVSARTYNLILRSGVSMYTSNFISNNKFANEGRALLMKELLEFARSERMSVTGDGLPLRCVITNYSYTEDEKEGLEVTLVLQEVMTRSIEDKLDAGHYRIGAAVRLGEAASKLLFEAKKGLGGGVL